MHPILLTGATGQVGFELQRALGPLGPLTCATRSGQLAGGAPCDVLDLERPDTIADYLDRLGPRIIVNPAAYTAVDRAESEPDRARLINVDAVAEIAQWCEKNRALLVHFSTDYVFDGRSEFPWKETDPTAPLGVYGLTKRDGERAVRDAGTQHLILRTAWVYAARGSNFLRTMLRLAGERDALRVVDDQRGAPTPAHWIASATALMLGRLTAASKDGSARADSSAQLGTFHLSAAGASSWFGFAEALFASAVRAGVLERSPSLQAIASVDYPTPARRPGYSVLDCQRLADAYRLQLPDWSIGMAEVMGELSAKPIG